MNAFANHFWFEFRTGIRNVTLLLLTYLIPLGLYVLMGFVLIDIDPAFGEMFIPLMTIIAILLSTLLGLPDLLVTARKAGIFRNYKINGVPTVSLLIIPALTTIFHLVIVTIIFVVAAASLFSASVPIDWLGFVVTFIVTAFALAGLGVLIGVISASSRITVLWSQAIFIPTMVVMWIPASVLPDAVIRAAQLLPPTHATNAFRGLAMGLTTDFNALGSLVVLATGGVLAFGLAIYLFSWDSHNETWRAHPALALLALLPYVIGVILF
jgi:ABC-2 type transport system permease protein